MLAAVRSATLVGVDGQPVTVEVHVSPGLPSYSVVGMPDTAVRESRERVRAALLSSGLPWPQQRITVNLAPGAVRKTGAGLELAVALGLLGGERRTARWRARRRGRARRARPRRLGTRGARHVGAGRRARSYGHRVDGGAVGECGGSGVGARRARARRRSLGELRACIKGETTWPDWDTPRTESDDAVDDEPLDLRDVRGLPFARRRARSGRRRISSPLVRRTTRHGQDDARPSPAHDPPTTRTPSTRSRSRASTPLRAKRWAAGS